MNGTGICRSSPCSTEWVYEHSAGGDVLMEDGGVDLPRLVEIIVEEVLHATRPSAARCKCHSVIEDCCPRRLQGVLDAGAARLGVHAAGGAPDAVAGLIDHTLLKPEAS